MDTFVKGLILGFSIAAIIGPIGILCIQRTLAGGTWYGFISGLGAATADALYASIAAFGLVFISNILTGNRLWIQSIGGLALVYIGCRAFGSKVPRLTDANTEKHNLLWGYGSTLLLTLANPMTVLSFVAAFVGLGITENANYVSASLFVIGVFAGSGLWWLVLSYATAFVRQRLSTEHLDMVNRAASVLIAGIGILVLASVRV